MTHCGKYDELRQNSPTFINLLGNICQHEAEEKEMNECEKDKTPRENNFQKENLSKLDNIERKEVGMVNWRVYTNYLRSGVGLYFGFILILILFSIREYISIFSDRWLSNWSYDQTYRYQIAKHCQNRSNHSITTLNDQQWTDHQNHRYYVYLISVIALLVVTLIRVSITEFIFLNAGRVLHNRMFHRFIRAPIAFFDTNPIGKENLYK